MISANSTGKRRQGKNTDRAAPNEGHLSIAFGDTYSILIGDNVRIHLDRIVRSGTEGGIREVRVHIYARKDIPIKRIEPMKG